jgi:hypothetical protein
MTKLINYLAIVGILAAPLSALVVEKPATAATQVLETTYEACSKDKLTVNYLGGVRLIKYAQSAKNLPVATNNIIWFCGGSQERTGCAAGTNMIDILRSGGRRFTVVCKRTS